MDRCMLQGDSRLVMVYRWWGPNVWDPTDLDNEAVSWSSTASPSWGRLQFLVSQGKTYKGAQRCCPMTLRISRGPRAMAHNSNIPPFYKTGIPL